VEVFWEKTDFAELGKEILGTAFHTLPSNLKTLKTKVEKLKKGDVVLLESKLSKPVTRLF